MSKGKLVGILAGAIVLYMLLFHKGGPVELADFAKGIIAVLKDAAQAIITFIQRLFA